MLQEKQFYLDQLKDGPVGHRHIMSRMSTRFNISAVAVRDALIRDGLIEVVGKKRIGSSQKFNYMMALIDKDAVVEMQQPNEAAFIVRVLGQMPTESGAFPLHQKLTQQFKEQEQPQVMEVGGTD